MNIDKIRIVFLVNGLRIGGLERWLMAFLDRIDRSRFEISVFCITNAPLLNGRRYKVDFPVYVNNNAKYSLTTCIRLFFFLKKSRPHILNSFLFHSNILGRIIGRLAGVPIIISEFHSQSYKKKLFYIIMERITWRMADHIWAVSQGVRDSLVAIDGIARRRISVVPIGIDYASFSQPRARGKDYLGIARDNFVVGSVCRFIPQKNLTAVLLAMKIVFSRIPQSLLVIAGDGPERKKLEDFCSRNDIRQRVIFTGLRGDIADILDTFDIFINLSESEGMPCSVMEAMAKGIPVIASDIAAHRQLVIDGVTGRIVPGDNPVEISNAIIELYSKKRNEFPAMAEKSRERIKDNFDSAELNLRRQQLYFEYSEKKFRHR